MRGAGRCPRCRGDASVVIDSDDLVARPGATMAAYCAAVGLPFIPRALTWEPGERPEWRRSARWHVDVSVSSGFERRERVYPHTVGNSAELARFAARHRRSTSGFTRSGWTLRRGSRTRVPSLSAPAQPRTCGARLLDLATIEAKQSGTSATAPAGRRANPLTRRACRSSMTAGRRFQFPRLGALCVPGGRPPSEPQDPSPPHGPAVGGPPALVRRIEACLGLHLARP